MTDLIRTTIIQAFADLLCLTGVFTLYPAAKPHTLLLAYYGSKIALFTAYRFGGNHAR